MRRNECLRCCGTGKGQRAVFTYDEFKESENDVVGKLNRHGYAVHESNGCSSMCEWIEILTLHVCVVHVRPRTGHLNHV